MWLSHPWLTPLLNHQFSQQSPLPESLHMRTSGPPTKHIHKAPKCQQTPSAWALTLAFSNTEYSDTEDAWPYWTRDGITGPPVTDSNKSSQSSPVFSTSPWHNYVLLLCSWTTIPSPSAGVLTPKCHPEEICFDIHSPHFLSSSLWYYDINIYVCLQSPAHHPLTLVIS